MLIGCFMRLIGMDLAAVTAGLKAPASLSLPFYLMFPASVLVKISDNEYCTRRSRHKCRQCHTVHSYT